MPRLIGAMQGTIGVALVTVVLVAGFAVSGIPMTAHASSGHSSGGLVAGSKAETAVVPDRTYETTVAMGSFTVLGATTAVPQGISIYVNVTWGSIDNTNTRAWVVVHDLSTDSLFKAFSLNGTINTAKVVKFNNNGVLYQNYTWNFSLNKTTLGCAKVSCADIIPATNDYMYVLVSLTENGTSLGGGKAVGSTYVTTYFGIATQLVSTFANAGFIAPAPTWNYIYPIPFRVSFFTNISWGYSSNATTKVTLQVLNYYTDTTLENLSFNGSVNATNSHGFTSSQGFNGTVAGVPYSYVTWTLILNETTLGCSTVSCNTTAPFDSTPYGDLVGLIVWVNESGASAGGLSTPTGPQVPPTGGYYLYTGSTLLDGGIFGSATAPVPYQPLPYVQTGWLNVSWVNPAADTGNTSVGGDFYVYDLVTSTTIATLSLAGAVNTTNSHGVSLKPVLNGTTALGIPYINYTWSVDFTATASSLGVTVPYDEMDLLVNVTANGDGHGGIKQWTTNLSVFHTTFVQYPTTVAVSISPHLPAYVPIPYTQNFTIAVTNAPISPSTTSITVNLVDLTVNTAGLDVVSSTAVTVVSGQTLYTFSLDTLTLTCSTPSCEYYSELGQAPSPTDIYGVQISATVDGAGLPTNGSVASGTASASFYVIEIPLSAKLAAPNPGNVITPGNVTVSVVYSGSFVSTVTLTIFSPTGAPVLSVSFPTSGYNSTWVVTAPGVYTASVVVLTGYTPTTHYFNATLTVAKTPTNRVNSTSYSNSTLIPGLSPATAGTLLLAIGLIVGMIAAFVVGRLTRGRPAPAPPQAWQEKPGEGGAPQAGANTCSTCGKSFATPDELQAHSKSEHGMV